MEMTLEYWNALAHQTTLIASLLSGFSIAVVAHMIVSDKKDRLTTMILKAATLSAGCFLVAVCAIIQISMATTPGAYLKDVVAADFLIPRAIGIFTFITGLFSLTVMISLSGWSKSKKVGVFTTIVGVLTLLLILITMTCINF